MTDHTCPDLDQLQLQAGQRPVGHGLGQLDAAQEGGQVVRQGVQLQPHLIVAELPARQPRPAKGVFALFAGKSLRGGRITPGEWERRRGLRLRFVYRRTGPSLLVAEGRLNRKGQAVVSRSKTGRGKVTAPIFLLVPQVKLPKRLDLARDAERAVDSVPGRIVAGWLTID